MSIKYRTELGGVRQCATVDHDPTAVATDLKNGGIIIEDATSKHFHKLDDGSTTNVAEVISPTFAEIWGENQSTNLTLTDMSTWYQYVQFEANGENKRCTPDHTNDHITIDEAGTYLVMCSCSFQATNGEEYELELQKNNGATRLFNLHAGQEVENINDMECVSMSGLLALSATDTIELWVRCASAAGSFFRGRDVNLTVMRIF